MRFGLCRGVVDGCGLAFCRRVLNGYARCQSCLCADRRFMLHLCTNEFLHAKPVAEPSGLLLRQRFDTASYAPGPSFEPASDIAADYPRRVGVDITPGHVTCCCTPALRIHHLCDTTSKRPHTICFTSQCMVILSSSSPPQIGLLQLEPPSPSCNMPTRCSCWSSSSLPALPGA